MPDGTESSDNDRSTTGAPGDDTADGQTATGAVHGQFLVTSDERDAAEARLRQAVADEVLSLEEFGDRMRLLLSAQTRSDLQRAVADLPDAREAPARTAHRGRVRSAPSQRAVVAIVGSSETRGRWHPDRATTAFAMLGDATVDLQGVESEADELTINAFSVLGQIEIVIPEGVEVEMGGMSILGEPKVRTDRVTVPGAPLVRVDGLALLGEITVRHPTPVSGSSLLTAVVSTARLADGEDVSVGALTAFGSVSVQVPEGVNVERDGVVAFAPRRVSRVAPASPTPPQCRSARSAPSAASA